MRQVSSSRRRARSIVAQAWGLDCRAPCSLAVAAMLLSSCGSYQDASDPPPVTGGAKRIVPTDERPVVQATNAPPVSGGNLLQLQTAGEYLVTDPARDRIVTVANEQAITTELSGGSRPERSALGADGLAYVVLRGSGKLAVFDPATRSVVAQNRVCAAPRGVAYDSMQKRVVVACAEGRLVFHSPFVATAPDDFRVLGSVAIDTDARDVVVQKERIYVSRFRSAEVHELSSSGELVSVFRSPNVFTGSAFEFTAGVAWRMIPAPNDDGVLVLHQRATTGSIAVQPHDADSGTKSGGTSPVAPPADGSSYGGGTIGSCTGIVQTAITKVSASRTVSTSPSIDGAVLAVDFAATDDPSFTGNLWFALADAGVVDAEMPTPTTEFAGGTPAAAGPIGAFARGAIGTTQLFTEAQGSALSVGCQVPSLVTLSEPTSSVVRDGSTALFVSPETATLRRFDGTLGTEFAATAMGGAPITDTGHTIFHRDTGAGIACASCHPEGGDDGRVWLFDTLGPRRTMNLAAPVNQTAPYHWDGALETFENLMDDVFVGRMGGVFESPERLERLQGWLSEQPAQVLMAADTEAAARGKVLFDSTEVGCAKCHSGALFTDNKAYEVGTTLPGEKLQVPALTQLALHPPYMHTGCAQTLRERFVGACGGGDDHGHTSQLDSSQIDDLVAYLTTL